MSSKKSFTDPARLFIDLTPPADPEENARDLERLAAEAEEELTPTGKKRMQIIVSAATYERLRAKAYRERRSMNEIINNAIERTLKE